jgi:alpha-tubulin suppressor-like RCC1 family protein
LFVSLLIVGCGGGGGDNPSEVQFKTIVAGSTHSFALSNDGKVYAAGWNEYYQLGLGDTTDRNVFTEVTSLSGKNIIALSAGIYHSLALSSNGKVYATGDNEYGQIGFGSDANKTSFTEVGSLSGKTITAIFAGGYHSLAIDNDGKVYATGLNEYGQLGLDDKTDRNVFTEVTSLNGKTITALSAGDLHSLALANDGKVYATGENHIGQLGLGDTTERNTSTEVGSLSNITAISAGYVHSLALANDGKVYATGDNEYGQLGLGSDANKTSFTEVSTLSGITTISTGDNHFFALSNDGKVYATGLNYDGQLGLGDNTDKNTSTEVSSLSGKNIAALSAGNLHSLALSNDGKIYAAGRNFYGQLGLGDKIDRNAFTKVTVWND